MKINVDTKQRRLTWGQLSISCAIGHGGAKSDKVEGDRATPLGIFTLRRLLYRADRISDPVTGLPMRPIGENDGWCDAPLDANYNRLVNRPYPASHEQLWRPDHLYDLLIILGHNDDPVRPGKGSAIFFHLAHDDFRATEGCVAILKSDFCNMLAHCNEASSMEFF